MRYLGGKSKIAKEISSVILSHTQNRETLWEPFIGGGSMTYHLAPHFNMVNASDVHEDLILMRKALQQGWVPSDVDENLYAILRNSPPSPLRGFAGFGCSFGGKWFGGYARAVKTVRNYGDESRRNLLKIVNSLINVNISCQEYKYLEPRTGDVVYCDPPYQSTTEYRDKFNSPEFWDIMRAWSTRGISVFVSEYQAPKDWVTVWEKTRTRDLKSKFTNAEKVTERLFILGENI